MMETSLGLHERQAAAAAQLIRQEQQEDSGAAVSEADALRKNVENENVAIRKGLEKEKREVDAGLLLSSVTCMCACLCVTARCHWSCLVDAFAYMLKNSSDISQQDSLDCFLMSACRGYQAAVSLCHQISQLFVHLYKYQRSKKWQGSKVAR